MPAILVEAIAKAIGRMEGFYTPGSLAAKNNNPGNLRLWGSHPVINGYVHFSTEVEGWQALYSQIQINIRRGLTLQEFFGGKPGVYPGYAPSADANHPIQYAQFVARAANIPDDVPLNTLGNATHPVRPRTA